LYLGLRVSTTLSFGTPDSKTKGPVPTGCAPKLEPYFATAAGDTGASATWVSESRNGANGAFSRMITVYCPTLLNRLTGPVILAAHGDLSFGLRMRLNEKITARALKGVPSWNLTPCRRCKVTVFSSFDTLYDWTSPGTMRPVFGSRRSSGS
jgi:hypothetical protein